MHPKSEKFCDPKLIALADLLGVEHPAAVGLRGMLLELSIDFLKSPDLTDVTRQQWALVFRIPTDDVSDLIDCFVDAKLLERANGKLLLADWDKHASDESGAAFRSWFRGHNDKVNALVDELYPEKR